MKRSRKATEPSWTAASAISDRDEETIEAINPSSRAVSTTDRRRSAHHVHHRPTNLIWSVPLVLTLLVCFCLGLAAWVWFEILWRLS